MEDWTKLDELQLDIYNRLKFYFGHMLLYFEILEIDEALVMKCSSILELAVSHLNNNGFCSRAELFKKATSEEARFIFEWKLTYTEFMNVVLMPNNQIAYLLEKTFENLGPCKYGFTNAKIDQMHNEASTQSILCLPPEHEVFQNMVVILAFQNKVLFLVTYNEY